MISKELWTNTSFCQYFLLACEKKTMKNKLINSEIQPPTIILYMNLLICRKHGEDKYYDKRKENIVQWIVIHVYLFYDN